MAIQTALSVVVPSGSRIVDGIKSIEVRSWRPSKLPILNLLIVENLHYLNDSYSFDPNGLAVALVDIYEVHEWQPDELNQACASKWSPGYWAWRLENIRAVLEPFPVSAQRHLYQIDIDLETIS
jgi:hypothetical protein